MKSRTLVLLLLAAGLVSVPLLRSVASRQSAPPPPEAGTAVPHQQPAAEPVVVVIDTTLGEIEAELWPDKAPVTVENFLQYARDGFYDDTRIHRVVPEWVIQGGGQAADGSRKRPRPPIKNEADNGLSNVRGSLGMARTANPDSASSQFYVNLADNTRLDKANAADGHGYAVFGKVTGGMDVVDRIAAVPLREGTSEPLEPVLVRSVKVKGDDPPPDLEKIVFVMETSLGEIEGELWPDKAPVTVENFVRYVKDGFYAETVFHRVVPEFVIQGGGYRADMTLKETRPPIKNEADNGLRNERGTFSMARTGDPHSATSQFFINLVDNRSLDRVGGFDGVGYAVFGKVTRGMEVVEKIAGVPLRGERPVEPVVINAVKIREAATGEEGQ